MLITWDGNNMDVTTLQYINTHNYNKLFKIKYVRVHAPRTNIKPPSSFVTDSIDVLLLLFTSCCPGLPDCRKENYIFIKASLIWKISIKKRHCFNVF